MNAKLWILALGTTTAVFLFHQNVRAEETTPPLSNVFLDEGDADYEMPKIDADSTPDTKPAAKKTAGKKQDAKSRVPANDDDDDKPVAATKGDAFDQVQNPETAQATEKKLPAKVTKSPEEKKTVAAPVEEVAPQAPTAAPSPAIKEAAAPAPAPKAAKAPATRKTASAFTQGFKTTKGGDCAMYADTDKTSAQVLTVQGPKKLWVEQNGDWYKAYHKKGSGYLPAECFE